MIELLGLVLPPVIDLINRKVLDSDVRFWISVLVCAVVGIAMKYLETNGFVGYANMYSLAEDTAKTILVVFGLAQLSFKAGYENSRIRSKFID